MIPAAMTWLRQLRRFLADSVRWLFEAYVGWLVILGLLGLFPLISILFACFEQRVRYTGLVLQLVGLVTVAISLWGAQRLFQHPNLWRSIRAWWERRPRFGAKHYVMMAGTGSIGMSGGSARLRISPGPNTLLDERVKLLEDQYKRLDDEVGKLSDDVRKSVKDYRKALETERSERQNADQKIQEQLNRAIVGDLHLEFAGVLFFAIGIITATASPEIARMVGAAACQ